jgi:hypothetical protein
VSLEQYSFLNALPDRAAWQAAIDELGIDLKLDPEMDLARDSGFSPCEIKGRASGFEILVEKAEDVLGIYPTLKSRVAGRGWVMSFRWGGDFAECACVLGASHALLRSFGAVVCYPDDDIVYDEATLLRELRQCLADIQES